MKKLMITLIAGAALMLGACTDQSAEVYDEAQVNDVEMGYPDLVDYDEWTD